MLLIIITGLTNTPCTSHQLYLARGQPSHALVISVEGPLLPFIINYNYRLYMHEGTDS